MDRDERDGQGLGVHGASAGGHGHALTKFRKPFQPRPVTQCPLWVTDAHRRTCRCPGRSISFDGQTFVRAIADRAKKCNDLQCYSRRGLAHRVIAVGRHARYAAGGGGGGFGGLGGGGFGGLDSSMGQPIPGLSPAAAEEMVTHVYLCVGAVGEFFDFVTDCFIASCVPIDIRTPSTRPYSLRRNLIGRAKYTEPNWEPP